MWELTVWDDGSKEAYMLSCPEAKVWLKPGTTLAEASYLRERLNVVTDVTEARDEPE